jgi:hypothetical protein
MKKTARKITTLDATALLSSSPHHPNPAQGRTFGAARLPQDFHTVVDPNKHPSQPWRDLPPPTGLPPFRMSLDGICRQRQWLPLLIPASWYFKRSVTPVV